MITTTCQRWRSGRSAWRPAREPFDPRRYEVAPIPDDTTAKAFVVAHHYAASYPSAKYRFGLYEGAALVGVVVFSTPMHPAVLAPFEHGTAVELGRLVLLDEVLGNAESWTVARCFDLIRREGIEGVVSFSDPEPRTAVDGRVIFAGHVGATYASLSAVYAGRASAKTQRLLPDGTEFSARAASKIRNGERGWRYAVDQLVAAGAPPPTGPDLGAWLAPALAATTRTQRHPGNHRFEWGLTRAAKKLLGPSLRYPKFNLRDCAPGATVHRCGALQLGAA